MEELLDILLPCKGNLQKVQIIWQMTLLKKTVGVSIQLMSSHPAACHLSGSWGEPLIRFHDDQLTTVELAVSHHKWLLVQSAVAGTGHSEIDYGFVANTQRVTTMVWHWYGWIRGKAIEREENKMEARQWSEKLKAVEEQRESQAWASATVYI